MRRRDFIKFVAGSVAAWPTPGPTRSNKTMPVIGLLDVRQTWEPSRARRTAKQSAGKIFWISSTTFLSH
jgi:hypothetical protein